MTTPAPVYFERLCWYFAGAEKPPIDQDVLVTFEDVAGAYIAAWMGSETGWIGVDALPLEKVAWWAVLPPGPGPAMTKAAAEAAMAETGQESRSAWDDPRVQKVYDILCDDATPPNKQEHWEGWIARRIVDALAHPQHKPACALSMGGYQCTCAVNQSAR